jgi:anti-sigma B factor antagonist
MGKTMEVLERVEGDTLVAKVVAARLDAASAPGVKRRISQLIARGHRRLVLDISEVDFIDSDGLSSLAFAFKRLGANGDLAISGPRSSVLSMLRLTRLHQVFNIFPDSKQAIAGLRTLAKNAAAFDGSQSGSR